MRRFSSRRRSPSQELWSPSSSSASTTTRTSLARLRTSMRPSEGSRPREGQTLGRATACAERRAAVLEAALELFATTSYASATTAEIARAAGVSEPILYRHFASKRDLWLACLDAAWDDVRAGDRAKDHGDERRRHRCRRGTVAVGDRQSSRTSGFRGLRAPATTQRSARTSAGTCAKCTTRSPVSFARNSRWAAWPPTATRVSRHGSSSPAGSCAGSETYSAA